jgi:hypothetical protein
MNKERLLNVAKALRESQNPQDFDMGTFVHGCGTPACALGHYGCRPDLQDTFFTEGGSFFAKRDGKETLSIFSVASEHFDITMAQCDELFEANGCGYAETPTEAAAYIERFVAEHS